MPVYAYRCQSCGAHFEKTQKFNDQPVTRCIECHKAKVQRLVQPSAIIFKGSGWYVTDHRSVAGQGGRRKLQDNLVKGDAQAGPSDGRPAAKPKKLTKSDD